MFNSCQELSGEWVLLLCERVWSQQSPCPRVLTKTAIGQRQKLEFLWRGVLWVERGKIAYQTRVSAAGDLRVNLALVRNSSSAVTIPVPPARRAARRADCARRPAVQPPGPQWQPETSTANSWQPLSRVRCLGPARQETKTPAVLREGSVTAARPGLYLSKSWREGLQLVPTKWRIEGKWRGKKNKNVLSAWLSEKGLNVKTAMNN